MRVVIKDVYKEVMDIEPEWTVGHLKNRIEMARGDSGNESTVDIPRFSTGG